MYFFIYFFVQVLRVKREKIAKKLSNIYTRGDISNAIYIYIYMSQAVLSTYVCRQVLMLRP